LVGNRGKHFASVPVVSDSSADGHEVLCPAGSLKELIKQDVVCTLCL